MRILARADDPSGEACELDWINGRTRILGEGFGMASRAVQELIDNGTMIVIHDDHENNEKPDPPP